MVIKKKEFIPLDKAPLPLEGLEQLGDEKMCIVGGNDPPPSGGDSGCQSGSGCGCGCGCSSGKGCGCGCECNCNV